MSNGRRILSEIKTMEPNDKKVRLLTLIALTQVLTYQPSGIGSRERNDTPPETDEQRGKRLGLKEWNIDGKVIYAATKRKALKIASREI